MQFGAGDLDLFFGDMGVPVVAGAASAIGLVDQADVEVEVAEGMGATSRHTTVLLRADALPLVGRHQTVTVDGVDYIVRDVRLEDDGALKRLILAVNDP